MHTCIKASLCVLVLSAVAVPLHAATALIDFGTSNGVAGYNSVSMTASGSGVVALTDTTSAATGWSASVVETGTGGGGNAGAAANVTTFPAGLAAYDTLALQDSIFANQGTGTAPAMVLTFSGLSPVSSYHILLYGSRANGQGADQRWRLTQGTGGADVNHFSELNSTVYVDWNAVVPNAGGVVEVTIDSPGPDNLGALALNFGSISEVPEPSGCVVLALSGFAFSLRRRR